MTAFSNDPLYPPRFGVFLKFEWPVASKQEAVTESDRVPDLPTVTAETREPSAEPPESAETREPSAEPAEPSAEPLESAEPPEPSAEPSATPREPSAEPPSAESREPSPRSPSAAPSSPEKWSAEAPAPRANLKILELTFGDLLRRKDAW
jgi:hypothetical protein